MTHKRPDPAADDRRRVAQERPRLDEGGSELARDRQQLRERWARVERQPVGGGERAPRRVERARKLANGCLQIRVAPGEGAEDRR